MPREDKDYASKGVAGSGLGIAIGALALSLLNKGNISLGNLLGGNGNGGVEAVVAVDALKRVCALEAGQAAMAVAVAKDAEISKIYYDFGRRETRLEIDAATCHCIKGDVTMPPGKISVPCYGGVNLLTTHHVPHGGYGHGHGGCGCDHGHGHGHNRHCW